jgi:NAD(P)-dependent dehydrogenase (short-subunit alcohol dehydrogenase family)
MPVADVSDHSLAEVSRLDGRVAVVTGGAKGIGAGMALRFAEAGADVVLADLDLEAAKKSASEIAASSGSTAIALTLDVTDPQSIAAVLDTTVEEFGRLDIWVNNAGIYPSSPILEQSTEEWRSVLEINLDSVFVASREAARRMVELGNGGAIINVSSVAGLKTRVGGSAHYNVSKIGVVMLTQVLALELGPHGIRVNAVAPGLVATPGTLEHPVYREYFEVLQPMLPLRRTLVPDDVARVALFLASDMSMAVTGSVLAVESGELLT